MSALEIARKMMMESKPPNAVNAKDAESPPPLPVQTTLSASTAYIASAPELGNDGSAAIIGLTTTWHKILRHRAGCGDRAAARELVELEAYLGACDRGEVVLPAHPSDESLREWNRLADERHRSKHRKQ